MNIKPRNHVVLALIQLKKKSGAHGKTEKAQRRQNKVNLQKKQDE